MKSQTYNGGRAECLQVESGPDDLWILYKFFLEGELQQLVQSCVDTCNDPIGQKCMASDSSLTKTTYHQIQSCGKL